MSAAEESLRFTGLFESELLVELILRYWEHPRADDREFRNEILEAAAEALRASVDGQRLLEDVRPQNINLVAAIWYAEFLALGGDGGCSQDERVQRQEWLDKVRRAVPTCFCDPELLP